MNDIAFGGCLFKHFSEDGSLQLHTHDIHGAARSYKFHLTDAFLVDIGNGFWRFVTGAIQGTGSRHIFDDGGIAVIERVDALRKLGVPVLSREEGRKNLEKHKLPVKRLMLTS